MKIIINEKNKKCWKIRYRNFKLLKTYQKTKTNSSLLRKRDKMFKREMWKTLYIRICVFLLNKFSKMIKTKTRLLNTQLNSFRIFEEKKTTASFLSPRIT